MIGKAGRPGLDESGCSCVYLQEEKKNFFQKFLYEPFPVESSLQDNLTDYLNTEIAQGSAKTIAHIVDSLKWTYFFRRLTKNPTYYGLVEKADTTEYLEKIGI
jgi:activating signal cointegrator complex subunit 3